MENSSFATTTLDLAATVPGCLWGRAGPDGARQIPGKFFVWRASRSGATLAGDAKAKGERLNSAVQAPRSAGSRAIRAEVADPLC